MQLLVPLALATAAAAAKDAGAWSVVAENVATETVGLAAHNSSLLYLAGGGGISNGAFTAVSKDGGATWAALPGVDDCGVVFGDDAGRIKRYPILEILPAIEQHRKVANRVRNQLGAVVTSWAHMVRATLTHLEPTGLKLLHQEQVDSLLHRVRLEVWMT